MGVIKSKKAFLAFLLPGLLLYILAVFYPIEESIRLSFMKWGGIGDKEFVGFQNYITMFHDKVFYTAFINNLIYLVIVVSMQLAVGLFFAILLTYMTRHVTLVKTLYYVPCIITTVAITQLFRSIYSTEPMGLLNQFLQAAGLDGMVTSWLAEVSTALAAVSIPEGWRFTGMYMVIFYAALVSLDPSVYEAAKVDGADMNGLRNLGDQLKEKLGDGVILLASDQGDYPADAYYVPDRSAQRIRYSVPAHKRRTRKCK